MNSKGPFKRKRRDTFVRKAKKYLKRGGPRRGHGTHIEQDVFEYFCRVLDVWNKGFDSEEDKKLFADNVLDQTQGSEMDLVTSQLTSRAIETVVGSASVEKVITLESALRNDLRVAFVDRFCSHLTQNLILASAHRVTEGKDEKDESFAFVCMRFSINNIEEFAWHACACHVVRTCLEAVNVMGNITQEYSKLYYGAIIESPALTDICSMELGSGLVQALLKCLNTTRPKLCQKAITTLLKQVFTPEDIANESSKIMEEESCEDDIEKDEKKSSEATMASVFTTQPSVRLLECAIEYSTSKRFTQIYAELFINRLQYLATQKCSNMAVQSLIRAAQDKTEFESIFDELVKVLPQILRLGYTGVFVSLASACQRLGVRQGQFLNILTQCLRCESNELVLVERCLLLDSFIGTNDINHCDDETISVSLQGSLIVQSLLHFQKPIKVINSLLNMDTNQLIKILNDRKGCHITDAFFTGQFVGEKSKEKFFNKIKDKLVELVTVVYGSRSFDALWNGVSMKHRQIAAEKLSAAEATVSASQFGRIIAKKIHLASYRRDPKGWMSALSSANSAQKLFSDIIGPAYS